MTTIHDWRVVATGATTLRERIVASARNTSNALTAVAKPGVAYIGWLGHENLGDDLMFTSIRRAMPSTRLHPVAPGRFYQALRTITRRRVHGAVVGGGTLVGNKGFRSAIERFVLKTPGVGVETIGTGVQDPEFGGLSVQSELEAWGPILSYPRSLTVRGPRSAEILASLGFDSRVVGDPALLVSDGFASVPHTEGLVTLNLGVARRIWGDDPSGVLRTVGAFGKWLRTEGWDLRLLCVWPPDLGYIREANELMGGGLPVVSGFQPSIDLIRRSHVLVGLKLHSVVLAAAFGVPSLMLEYQPKCRDFQRSIGRTDFCLRTELLTDGILREKFADLVHSRSQLNKEILSRVGALKTRLHQHLETINGLGRLRPME